jgi:hypothetical protein
MPSGCIPFAFTVIAEGLTYAPGTYDISDTECSQGVGAETLSISAGRASFIATVRQAKPADNMCANYGGGYTHYWAANNWGGSDPSGSVTDTWSGGSYTSNVGIGYGFGSGYTSVGGQYYGVVSRSVSVSLGGSVFRGYQYYVDKTGMYPSPMWHWGDIVTFTNINQPGDGGCGIPNSTTGTVTVIPCRL